MEIIEVSPDVREVYAAEIPELVWSTGPVSYEYQFGTREIFDHAVRGSWPMDGTLFGADATALAIEDGALMGIEIGMRGTEYKTRQHALAPIWKNLIEPYLMKNVTDVRRLQEYIDFYKILKI